MPHDHRDDRVTPTAAAINCVQGGKHIRRRDARRADPLQLGGEHIQQHLGIGSRIEMAAVFADQHLGELRRVGQIAVVRQADSVAWRMLT